MRTIIIRLAGSLMNLGRDLGWAGSIDLRDGRGGERQFFKALGLPVLDEAQVASEVMEGAGVGADIDEDNDEEHEHDDHGHTGAGMAGAVQATLKFHDAVEVFGTASKVNSGLM